MCRLYNKAVALTRPFAYDEYRTQRIAEKVEAERQSRIGVVRKLPKVSLMYMIVFHASHHPRMCSALGLAPAQPVHIDHCELATVP